MTARCDGQDQKSCDVGELTFQLKFSSGHTQSTETMKININISKESSWH